MSSVSEGNGTPFVAAEPPQVVDAENFAELIEKGQNRYQQGVVFGVAGEMVGDAQGLFEVLFRDGLAEFEVIEILRDADVLFDVCIGDFLRSFRQREQQLAQFVGDFGEVGTQVVGQHRLGFRVDRAAFRGDELREPGPIS